MIFMWQTWLRLDLENCIKTSTLSWTERLSQKMYIFLCTLLPLYLGQKNSMWRCFCLNCYLWGVFFHCWFCVTTSMDCPVRNWYFSPSIKTILNLASRCFDSEYSRWVHSQRFFRWKQQYFRPFFKKLFV